MEQCAAQGVVASMEATVGTMVVVVMEAMVGNMVVLMTIGVVIVAAEMEAMLIFNVGELTRCQQRHHFTVF